MTRDRRPSKQTLAVLDLLLQDPDGWRYGLEIGEAVGLKTGSVYPLLATLERKGWVESAWEDIDPSEAKRPRRRYYRMTGHGARAARGALSEARQRSGVGATTWRPAPGAAH
jgi:PadR family transcriptional regulator PadR